MRFRDAVREAIANVRVSRVGAIAAVAGVLLAAAATTFTIREVGDLQRRYETLVEEGRFTRQVFAAGVESLNAQRCEAMSGQAGVIAAGSILESSTVFPRQLPFRPYDLTTITVGGLRALFPSLDQASLLPTTTVLAGADAATELGLSPGSSLDVRASASTEFERRRIAAVLPPSRRLPTLNRHLFVIQPPIGDIGTCLSDIEPDQFDAATAVIEAWFPTTSRVSIQGLPDADPVDDPPEAKVVSRVSRWGPLTVGAAAGVLVMVIWHGRRQEFALYRLLGVGKACLAIHFGVETVLLVLLPQCAGAAVAITWNIDALDSGVVRWLTELDVLRMTAIAPIVALLGWARHATARPFDVLKGQ